MPKRRDQFKRQQPVDDQTIAALTAKPKKGIVETLVDELGVGRERERKRPRRPTDRRRAKRRFHLTFSVEHGNAVDRLRDLARQWELYTGCGEPAISKVIEYLLLPQLEKAETGAIAPPSNGDGKNEHVEVESEQWY